MPGMRADLRRRCDRGGGVAVIVDEVPRWVVVETRHLVWVSEKRIECSVGCEGPLPHVSEFRAPDVNPNRDTPAESGRSIPPILPPSLIES